MINFANVKEWKIPYNGSLADVIRVKDTNNTRIIWEKPSPDPDYSVPFWIENITDTVCRLVWKQVGNGMTRIHVYKSTNGTTWSDAGTTETDNYIEIPARQRVYLRANTTTWGIESVGRCGTKQYGNSGCFKIGGNILSLLYGSSFNGQRVLRQQNGYDFQAFFSENVNIVDASELLISDDAYEGSYISLFKNCSYFTNAPKQLSSIIDGECFGSMFSNTLIEKSPVLPATTLSDLCYYGMFSGCSRLNEIKCYATSGFNSSQCLTNWTLNVSSTGTFYKTAGITWPSGVNGIPSGWTVVEV